MNQVQTSSQNTHGAGWLYKLMGLILGLSAAFLIIIALWLITSFPGWWSSAPRISLPLSVDFYPSEEMISLAPENTKISHCEVGRSFGGVVTAKFRSPWDQWIYILIFGLGKIILFLFVRELRRIVGSIAQGLAFSNQNARRFRKLSVLIFSRAAFDSVIVAGFTTWTMDSFVSSGRGMKASHFLDVFDTDTIIIIWVLFVLSEVFRQGAEMSKEQSLTI